MIHPRSVNQAVILLMCNHHFVIVLQVIPGKSSNDTEVSRRGSYDIQLAQSLSQKANLTRGNGSNFYYFITHIFY